MIVYFFHVPESITIKKIRLAGISILPLMVSNLKGQNNNELSVPKFRSNQIVIKLKETAAKSRDSQNIDRKVGLGLIDNIALKRINLS